MSAVKRMLVASRRLLPRLVRSSSTSFDVSSPSVRRYLEHVHAEYGDGVPPLHLRPLVVALRERARIMDDVRSLDELLQLEGDAEMRAERAAYELELKNAEERIAGALFDDGGVGGASECVVEVLHGVGGQEAMLFAGELVRMYCGYAAHRGWRADLTCSDETETGGVRFASMNLSGAGAYETMRVEAGVHRVQRVPATEKAGRLHTSTASVVVMMQPDEIEVNIPERDIKIERKRSSGAGGQSVNTTDSCVRIFHLPTGLIVECQQERDQHKNKHKAMARLRALLYQRQLDAQVQKGRDEKKTQMGSKQRNEKIRTYNFNQDRVTDHRLGSSMGTFHNLEGILEGGPALDSLIMRVKDFEHRRQVLRDIESFNDTLVKNSKSAKVT